MVFGRLYTEFPVKVVFLAALFVFELGSVLCAVAPSSAAFIIGRAVAGAGAAGLTSGVVIITGSALPPKKLPFYMGAFGAVYGVGAVMGPVLGGVLTSSYLTWRW